MPVADIGPRRHDASWRRRGPKLSPSRQCLLRAGTVDLSVSLDFQLTVEASITTAGLSASARLGFVDLSVTDGAIWIYSGDLAVASMLVGSAQPAGGERRPIPPPARRASR